MVSYTHITSCLRVNNVFPFVPLLNHPRISPITSNLPQKCLASSTHAIAEKTINEKV